MMHLKSLPILLLVIIFPWELDALYCLRCLSLESKGATEDEREEIRGFVVRELRGYYHIGTILRDCPEIDDSVSWSFAQLNEDQCPEDAASSTCSSGRMQIKSYTKDKMVVSHASVLGCANRNLLHAVKIAKEQNKCDLVSKNGTKTGWIHRMQLEHCSELSSLCYNSDFCVTPEQSVVKPFLDGGRGIARFDYGLVIGIIVFIIVMFGAIIGARLCSFPVGSPSSIPKTSENTDLVRIATTRSSTADKISSDDEEQNEEGGGAARA